MSKSRDIADSAATINYIDGLTFDAQSQLDGKATLDASPTFTGTVTATAFSGDGSGLTGVDSLPSQTGESGKFLTTDGTNASWDAVDVSSEITGTLPVANGGTGATTLTANNVLLGNGTSAPLAVAPSTSGNVLTSNGTTWESVAPAGGGFSSSVSIEGSTTWSIPAGVTLIKIYVTGGGGGAGTSYSCGGSAGGTAIKYLDVSAGGSITITIGSGGAFGSTGSAGGTSSAVYGVTTISGTGGGGGTGQYSVSGSGSGGDINIRGGCGSASGYQAEMAGGSFWGGPKTLYGGGAYGAGGSSYMAFGSPTGNAGMSGVVYIEY